jgi:hypothetical protein
MDFQKAFDKVPHKRLLEKIKSYGIVGPTLNWIEDFLKNRSQSHGKWDWFRMGKCNIWYTARFSTRPVLFVIYI